MGKTGLDFSYRFPQIPIFPNSPGWRTGFKAKWPHLGCRWPEIFEFGPTLFHLVPLSFLVPSADDLTVAPPGRNRPWRMLVSAGIQENGTGVLSGLASSKCHQLLKFDCPASVISWRRALRDRIISRFEGVDFYRDRRTVSEYRPTPSVVPISYANFGGGCG